MILRYPVLVVFGVISTASALRAETGPEAQAGRRLAEEVCAQCHAVRPGEATSPRRSAPSFQRIADTPGMTATALTVALRTSHRTMPNIMLDEKETREIIAYLTGIARSR
jgi:mono/diheme cytochrome c family protein